MDSIVNHITRYSTPVIAFIVCLGFVGYFVKFVVERSLVTEFEKRERLIEYEMKRQSNFQEKILWQKYLVLTEQNNAMNQLRTEINAYIRGTSKVKTFIKEGQVYRLTAVFEQLNMNRFLIGEDFYKLMTSHGRDLIMFSNVKKADEERYREFMKSALKYDEAYRSSMRAAFNISNSTTEFSHKLALQDPKALNLI